ncbi:hypothetical protein NDU88_004788 [Pleurodeles waltl]|uniref:Uncharacterized protein n=1 Tax=Pleurodeles waltl TaxID=8319 RepID=A0AAV7QD01_PLEWA|nr:hypothetical protein NDU88_004788 [Pleurodeles waltl]
MQLATLVVLGRSRKEANQVVRRCRALVENRHDEAEVNTSPGFEEALDQITLPPTHPSTRRPVLSRSGGQPSGYRGAILYAEAKAIMPLDRHHEEIMVFPKPGCTKDDPALYRPISILNLDGKILAKAPEQRLINHIPDLAHPDQSGFMPHWATHHIIRCVYGMALGNRLEEPSVISLAHINKAFAPVSREY